MLKHPHFFLSFFFLNIHRYFTMIPMHGSSRPLLTKKPSGGHNLSLGYPSRRLWDNGVSSTGGASQQSHKGKTPQWPWKEGITRRNLNDVLQVVDEASTSMPQTLLYFLVCVPPSPSSKKESGLFPTTENWRCVNGANRMVFVLFYWGLQFCGLLCAAIFCWT